MNSTRLLSTLESTFKNPKTKEKLRSSAKGSFNKGLGGTRVFDDFPELLPQKMILSLSESFQDLFLLITEVKETDSSIELVYAEDKKAIEVWVRKIIKIGIAELIAKDGNIKKEVSELLDWKDIQIEPCEVIAGFVGAIHAHIISNLNSESKQSNVTTAVFNYLNNNYGNWIKEELRKHRNESISTYDFFKQSAPRLLLVGTVAAGAALIIYNQISTGNEEKANNPTAGYRP